MNNLYAAREQIVEIYKSKANWIIMALRFIVSLMVLFYIRNNIGYMTMLNKSAILVGIAFICAILPLVMLALVAAIIIVLHTYTVSLVVSGIVACIFLLMFIIYLRFTSKQILALIVVPIALQWNVPYVIPVFYGLLGNPVAMIPMAFGVIVYYMIGMIAELPPVGASLDDGIAGMIEEGVAFIQTLAFDKEMMLIILVLGISVAVIWSVRQIRVNHAWKYAIGAGALTNVISSMVLSVMLEVDVMIFSVVLGALVASLVGIVVEFMFLSIDYARTEYLEYEDDEYHYYVKAVPIISVARKEKTVMRIHDVEEDTELDEDEEEREERTARPRRRRPIGGERARRPEVERKILEEGAAEDFGTTTVIQTEDIEQELRAHAMKNVNSDDVNERNNQVNMEILRESMKKELDL